MSDNYRWPLFPQNLIHRAAFGEFVYVADVIGIIQDEFEEKKDLPGFKELWAEKMADDNDDDEKE